MPDYSTFLAQLYARQPRVMRLGLDTISKLLDCLGRPHDAVPCIVVAGTNGKGSTSYLLAAALQAAGHRVGLFTSPHLLRFTERIQIQGKQIAPDVAARLGQRVLTAADTAGLQASFFECATALAFTYFCQSNVDIAVFEVGLGGRLDATNVAHKEMAVITPIARDHEEVLGSTLSAIAAEKAGIIAAGKPVVMAPQCDAARVTLTARAQALGAPLYTVHADASPSVAFLPPYQRSNKATAQLACAVLHGAGRFACPPAAFAQAAAGFFWPGRYHWLTAADALRVALPCPVILDGGHNPAGAQALACALAADSRVRGRRVHLIFSAVQGKDCDAIIDALRPLAASWHVCGVQSARRRDPADLARQLVAAALFADFPQAWSHLLARPLGADDIVLVTGSLFLVADALAHLTLQTRDCLFDA